MMFELFPEYVHIPRTREYRMHKWAFQRFVTRAIAISQTTANDLDRLWQFPADRTDLVYLCVTPIRDCRTPDFPDNVPVVLSPYNLEPRKNLKALLEAVASAKVPFTLVLCGRAAWTEEREQFFQKEVSCLGLAHRIHLTGPLTDPELNGWYRRANIFVFPSLYEGFRLPVLEAMTAGRCVLVHNDSAMAKLWTAPRAIHRSAMSWAARLMPARSRLPASGWQKKLWLYTGKC